MFNPFLKIFFMKNLFYGFLMVLAVATDSCANNSSSAPAKDSATSVGPDSAAKNGMIPPSAAPGNAGNSSLADSTYKSKDSNKIHKDTAGLKK